jgi:hypothetical protein
MKERLTELQEQLQSVRSALESMAARAAGLRGRVQALRAQEPPFVSSSIEPQHTNGNVPPPSSLAQSLERLTVISTTNDLNDGDDGRFVSDAWEIALINEEGD